jgi:hypothetical protein
LSAFLPLASIVCSHADRPADRNLLRRHAHFSRQRLHDHYRGVLADHHFAKTAFSITITFPIFSSHTLPCACSLLNPVRNSLHREFLFLEDERKACDAARGVSVRLGHLVLARHGAVLGDSDESTSCGQQTRLNRHLWKGCQASGPRKRHNSGQGIGVPVGSSRACLLIWGTVAACGGASGVEMRNAG